MRREFVYDPAGRELGQYNYTRGYWEDQYVPLGGRQLTKYYGCCDTERVATRVAQSFPSLR